MDSSHQLNILISGAGISGLTTAFWLIKYGFKVTIVESAPSIRTAGQALDIRGPALDVVEKMGLLDEIRKNSTNLTGMSMIDATTGAEIYRNTEKTITRGDLDSPDIEILRDDLCKILFRATVDHVTYIFDDSIASIQQDIVGVHVSFYKSLSNNNRFDLVIGADGMRSNVRRIVFGDDAKFTRYLGFYVGIFTMPNFLNLDHWEVFINHDNIPIAVCVVKEKESHARTYVGFASESLIEYDHHDIDAQKQIVIENTPNVGEIMPRILESLKNANDFYFDSMNQIVMDQWSHGHVTLIGDAGYSPSIALGQSTTVSMVAAYTLAGELFKHKNDLQKGLAEYESKLREYVEENQKQALEKNDQDTASESEETQNVQHDQEEEIQDVPDFTKTVVPFTLEDYNLYIETQSLSIVTIK